MVIMATLLISSACSTESSNGKLQEDENSIENEATNVSTSDKSDQSQKDVVDTEVKQTVLANHSGNINAGGKYIIFDEWVYFANILDEEHLYKMRQDGTKAEKLTDHPVKNLHIFGEWLYYVQVDHSDGQPFHQSLNKVKMDGSDETIVLDEPVGAVYGTDEDLLFIKDDYVHRLQVENGKVTKLPYAALQMVASDDLVVYYNHQGYFLGDLQGSEAEPLFTENYGEFILDGTYLFYTVMDGDSGLHRYSLEDREEVTIVSEKVDYFNVNNGQVYYSSAQSEVERKIYSVDIDGEQKEVLNTVLHSIHLTDEYVIGDYFRQGYGGYIFVNMETGEVEEVTPEE